MPVQMGMRPDIMAVNMQVNTARKGRSESPQPNGDECIANQAFTPGRDMVWDDESTEPESDASQHKNSSRVPQSPPDTHSASSATILQCDGSDCGQVIRAGENMHEPGGETGKQRKDHRFRLTRRYVARTQVGAINYDSWIQGQIWIVPTMFSRREVTQKLRPSSLLASFS